jgi:hypothetical protein
MTLSITKSGAFVNNGTTISFIKGISNVVTYINNSNNLSVDMEVENSAKFVKIFNQINNVAPASVTSELMQHSATFITFKFNFKTIK